MDQTAERYRLTARLLHWGTAILAIAMVAAGFLMIQEGVARPLQNRLFIFHKNVGLLVLTVVLVRLAYRATHPAPPLPDTVPPLQKMAAAVSHTALYVLLVAMPVLGYVRVKAGGFPIESLDAWGVPSLVPRSDGLAAVAKRMHWIGGIAFSALVAVHVSAAAYHWRIARDGVAARMGFGRPG